MPTVKNSGWGSIVFKSSFKGTWPVSKSKDINGKSSSKPDSSHPIDSNALSKTNPIVEDNEDSSAKKKTSTDVGNNSKSSSKPDRSHPVDSTVSSKTNPSVKDNEE